ncbi:glycoside hydrolase family 38 N-terminal domain-containing protein [Streptomyces sp. NPDC055056]
MTTAPPTPADRNSRTAKQRADAAGLVDCHVVTHVHWDREWYRPFEAFRARLVELAERVVTELDERSMSAFHLDGQTIVLSDVAALRPDLAERLRAHAAAGRLTLGPWHVLADNQLVSGESLVRNLLTARRWAPAAGALASVGYSPDAFGHPADLPRLLNGFGMDTALVWRGAPDGVARFRWRSPDGSEVFAVNQGYHAAEVLWGAGEEDDDNEASARLATFLGGERARLAQGPWLLMNGGDHIAPSYPGRRIAQLGKTADAEGTRLHQSTLEEFFAAARAASDPGELPVVDGELRHPAGHLTFILPGTLSARTYLKQANAAAQNLLERWAEPLTALHAPHDATLAADLHQAWELLLRNAPHDSLCGCSVDEVHRENAVRYERVEQLGELVVQRALLRAGFDTRLYGDRPHDEARLVVVNPQACTDGGVIETDVLTAPGRYPVELLDADDQSLPFESEPLGEETAFEADLDLLPDSRPSLRHRLRFRAPALTGFAAGVIRVRLADSPVTGTQLTPSDVQALDAPDGGTLTAAPDASLTWIRHDGTRRAGYGLLTDGGDRGDTYNYDPPADDRVLIPRLTGSRVSTSPVRQVIEIDAMLDLPVGLTTGRERRAVRTREVPVRIEVSRWDGDPLLRWHIKLNNTVTDHRLRLHVPGDSGDGTWTGDGHWSLIQRPIAADLGPLPQEAGHEAVCGSAPVQSFAAIGSGTGRTALFAPGLPEMRGLRAGETPSGADAEIAVTLLRSVGWLSRFDLRSRTTGAGPALPTPQAQCQGQQAFRVAMAVGTPLADEQNLVRMADSFRTPMRAWQLRPGTMPGAYTSVLTAHGGLLSALKTAEDGNGLVLRLSNPGTQECGAHISAAPGSLLVPSRLDEEGAGEAPVRVGDQVATWPLGPYATLTVRVLPPASGG